MLITNNCFYYSFSENLFNQDKYNENLKIDCNTILNYQNYSTDHPISSPFNEYVLENISQQGLSIHVNNEQENGDEEAEETEIHTVQLTKSKDQGLGLSVVGYIYKNPYNSKLVICFFYEMIMIIYNFLKINNTLEL